MTKHVKVTYHTAPAVMQITRAEYKLVWTMVNRMSGANSSPRIRAIKFIREQYNLGLYDAKSIVDTVANSPALDE